jgi:hypothetical protein
MSRKDDVIFIEKMNSLGSESIKNTKDTIDSILDNYKGTKDQKKNLSYLSKVIKIEEEILEEVKKMNYARTDIIKEKLLANIEKLVNLKQNICKNILLGKKL